MPQYRVLAACNGGDVYGPIGYVYSARQPYTRFRAQFAFLYDGRIIVVKPDHAHLPDEQTTRREWAIP